MRILILGGDGYLGWPTAMSFASKGHEVCNNFSRLALATTGSQSSPRVFLSAT
jgi:UDP-sulfoquinovose synthase